MLRLSVDCVSHLLNKQPLIGDPAVELGRSVVQELVIRNEIPPEIIDQLVFGQVVQMPAAPNIAREIVLGAGLSVKQMLIV